MWGAVGAVGGNGGRGALGGAGVAEEKNSIATSQGVDSIEKIKNIYHLQIQKHPLPTKEDHLQVCIYYLGSMYLLLSVCGLSSVADGYPFLHKQTSKEDSKAVFLQFLAWQTSEGQGFVLPWQQLIASGPPEATQGAAGSAAL